MNKLKPIIQKFFSNYRIISHPIGAINSITVHLIMNFQTTKVKDTHYQKCTIWHTINDFHENKYLLRIADLVFKYRDLRRKVSVNISVSIRSIYPVKINKMNGLIVSTNTRTVLCRSFCEFRQIIEWKYCFQGRAYHFRLDMIQPIKIYRLKILQ